ncbi:MAG: response regulator [Syntrophobacteraceae bacterium]
MNILLFDPHNEYVERLRALPSEWDDVSVITSSESMSRPSDIPSVDVVVACGDFSTGNDLTQFLLGWRTHPHTYLVPCWIAGEAGDFERRCLWPRLAIDSFQPSFDTASFCKWLDAVTKWQHERTLIRESDSLSAHGALELLSSLALRKASGLLSIFSADGSEGHLRFREGSLIDGKIGNLSGAEVCYELLSWTQGSYHWDPDVDVASGDAICPIPALIEEGLKLVQEANLLFSFVPDAGQAVERTESEAALDDGGVPFYASLKQLYSLITGEFTIAQLAGASPLCRPRTFIALAKWLSMEDIRVTAYDPPAPPKRLLIVDDSPLMRRALHSIFSADQRFDIVGNAENGVEALRMIEQLKPDVVTMDIQMPVMDGLTALKHIMVRQPIPVVVLSAFTGQTSPLTYQSFKYGAVDVLAKPAAKGNGAGMSEQAKQIRERVLLACGVRMEAARVIRRSKSKQTVSLHGGAPSGGPSCGSPMYDLMMLICGSGGFPLLLKLTSALSGGWALPPILACVAFPSKVIEALLPNLQEDSEVEIELLRPEQPLKSGVIHLYSNEFCCKVSRDGSNIRVSEYAAWSDSRRSVDACLMSAAGSLKDRLLALLISGTGDDGVEGMKRVSLDNGGAYVLTPEICLNPELPGKVLDQGLATEIRSVTETMSMLGGLFPREGLQHAV